MNGDTSSEAASRLSGMRLFLFDLDGTLYIGGRLFDFTLPLLSELKKRGKHYLFVTNNSSKSVEDYVKKLDGMGISASREDFLTSAQATAWYLRLYHPRERCYVCGTASLKAELAAEGLTVTEDPDRAGCVVMGYDTELNYQKLWDVSRILTQKPELPYIATNPDLVCPTEFGYVPDCGSVK